MMNNMSFEKIDWHSLVAGVIRKDKQAMNDFVEINQEPLLRFCIYLTGNKFLAEDICHDAFVKGIQSIAQLKNPVQCRAWLKQIAKRLFLDYKKSAAQRKTHVDFTEANSEKLQVESASDMQILALQALQELDEQDRQLVIMIDIEGHSYMEVAEVLKMKEGTVKSRLSRARKKMLEFIETFRGSESSKDRKIENIN